MNMFEQMPFSEKYPVFRKLAEIGDLRKLSREELELYDEDIKNMRDIYATRKFDVRQEKLATARRLLSMGLSDEQVATATELSLEEIQKLKEQAWTGLSFQKLKWRILDVFIEAWDMLDNNLAVATAKIISCNSAVATAELQDNENQIDIFHIFSITNWTFVCDIRTGWRPRSP